MFSLSFYLIMFYKKKQTLFKNMTFLNSHFFNQHMNKDCCFQSLLQKLNEKGSVF